MDLIVFTDLDGTLLDHDTYSWQGAVRALGILERLKIPLVFTTSKTRAEVAALQRAMGMEYPFITENGGGIFFPTAWQRFCPAEVMRLADCRVCILGEPYRKVRAFFRELQQKYPLVGFGDMSVSQIMQHTGLGRDDAVLAGQRDFTEPFLCQCPVEELAGSLENTEFQVTTGGRFHHLMGAGQDKGRAVVLATELLKGSRPEVISIGLGDSDNDLAMLRRVDIPVVIPKADGSALQPQIDGVLYAPTAGSQGWGMVMESLLDEWRKGRGGFSR